MGQGHECVDNVFHLSGQISPAHYDIHRLMMARKEYQPCSNCQHLQNEILRLKEIIKIKDAGLNTAVEVQAEVTPEDLRNMWNTIPGVHRCRILTGPSLKAVKSRIREHPKKLWWLDYFMKVSGSSFLTGKTTNWSATLVWVCGPKNMAKVVSGDYEDQAKPSKAMESIQNANRVMERLGSHETQ